MYFPEEWSRFKEACLPLLFFFPLDWGMSNKVLRNWDFRGLIPVWKLLTWHFRFLNISRAIQVWRSAFEYFEAWLMLIKYNCIFSFLKRQKILRSPWTNVQWHESPASKLTSHSSNGITCFASPIVCLRRDLSILLILEIERCLHLKKNSHWIFIPPSQYVVEISSLP